VAIVYKCDDVIFSILAIFIHVLYVQLGNILVLDIGVPYKVKFSYQLAADTYISN